MRQRLGIAQALVGTPARPAPRRAGQRARPDRPARGPRPHARAARRDDGLLLHPHPRRRPAGQRPRRDPRRRPPGPGRARPPSCSSVHPRPAAGRASAAPTTRPASPWPASPGVASVEPTSATATLRTYLVRIHPAPAGTVQREVTALRRRPRPDPHRERPRPPRPGGRVPPPHRHQGACGMTASTIHRAVGRVAAAGPRPRPASGPSSARTRRMAPGKRAWVVARGDHARSWS